MNFLIAFLLFCLLLALAWPLAILALLLLPLAWLVALPFRLAGIVVGAARAFVKAVLYLPARPRSAPAIHAFAGKHPAAVPRPRRAGQ